MTPDNEPSPEKAALSLASLSGRGQKLRRILSDVEEELDSLVSDLADVAATYRFLPSPLVSSRGPKPSLSLPSTEQRRILQMQANQGVSAVVIAVRPDGSSYAQVDGRAAVLLTPLMVHLLEILIIDNGNSTDELIGWKSIADISGALDKRTGKTRGKHAVSQLLCRLKDRFTECGENKYLILRHSRLGSRFALRRGPGPVKERDHR